MDIGDDGSGCFALIVLLSCIFAFVVTQIQGCQPERGRLTCQQAGVVVFDQNIRYKDYHRYEGAVEISTPQGVYHISGAVCYYTPEEK